MGTTTLLEQLKSLLQQGTSKIADKYSSEKIFDKVTSDGILLFGSGGFGKRTLKGLRELGIEPLGFVDNNTSLWGKIVEGLQVYSPADAVKVFPEAVYMVTVWSDKIGHPLKEVKRVLSAHGEVELVSFFWLYYQYPHIFLPYFSLDVPDKTIRDSQQILKAFSLWQDDASRQEYVTQIRMRIEGNAEILNPAKGSKYHFRNELFSLSDQDVIVDIGAFDGDTLRDFTGIQKNFFKKYFAFEPDSISFDRLGNYVHSLPSAFKEKIFLKNNAVSDSRKEVSFNVSGSLQSTFSSEGSTLVECVSLDETLFEEAPTYIKIDAEGAEPEIIKGAKKIITTYAPILAISVYHAYDHLWTLPLMFKDLSEEYNFFLRPLCEVSWDLVFYAVPKKSSN